MAMVQFLVTKSKQITRNNRLIPAGETIEIDEKFVKMYYDWGKVVVPEAPKVEAPAPVMPAFKPIVVADEHK